MPLRAYIDGEEIISFEQTDEQWNDLKKRLKSNSILKLACCSQVGFPRISSKGLKHFVHSTSHQNCDWKPETSEHLKTKIEIVKACRENGWNAIPEFSEGNWRADVLAIQNGKRIAFEVQWSKQTFEETKFRQERYKESKVRGCWLFRIPPNELKDYRGSFRANKEIPAFKIFKNESLEIVGQVNHIDLHMKEFIKELLTGKIKFCEHLALKPKQEVTIVFFVTKCWKCKKQQHLYTVENDLRSICDRKFDLVSSMWEDEDIDKIPQVYNAVKLISESRAELNLKVGKLKPRYSKTVEESYLSHGCYYCNAIFGDFHLVTEKMEGLHDSNSIRIRVEIEFGAITEAEQHWCYSMNGQHCQTQNY